MPPGKSAYEERLLRRDKTPDSHVKDSFSASEREAFLASGSTKPDDLICYDDLASIDPEDALVSNKSIEDHMAELQDLIGAYGDGDDHLIDNGSPSRPDPLKLLEAQCEAMREELREATKAKQDVEYELGQNVYKLQMRIASQHSEKSVLTERLQEAKVKVDRKHQEMVLKEKELSEKISAERAKHERVTSEMTQHLRMLQERFGELSQQVQKQWDVQVDLIKQLDQKNDEAAKYRAALHEERVRSWQQNDHVLPGDQSDGDLHKPSIRTAYGVEHPSMGTPQWRSQEECDKKIEELRRKLDKDKQELKRKMDDLTESKKLNGLRLVENRKAMDGKTRQLKVIKDCNSQLQQQLVVLKTNLQKIADNAGKQQPPTRSMSRASPVMLQANKSASGHTDGDDSVQIKENGMERPQVMEKKTKTEFGQARDLAEQIQTLAIQIGQQKLTLSELQQKLEIGNEAATKAKECEEELKKAGNQLLRLQQIKEEKEKQTYEAQNKLQTLQAKHDEYQEEQAAKANVEKMKKDKEEKEAILKRLRAANDQQEDELNRQGKCCMRAKASKPAASKSQPVQSKLQPGPPTTAPPPAVADSRQPAQTAQQPGKQATDRSKGKGDGKGKGVLAIDNTPPMPNASTMGRPQGEAQVTSKAPVPMSSNTETRASSSTDPRDSNAPGRKDGSRTAKAPTDSSLGREPRGASNREKSGRTRDQRRLEGPGSDQRRPESATGGPSSSSSTRVPVQELTMQEVLQRQAVAPPQGTISAQKTPAVTIAGRPVDEV